MSLAPFFIHDFYTFSVILHKTCVFSENAEVSQTQQYSRLIHFACAVICGVYCKNGSCHLDHYCINALF